MTGSDLQTTSEQMGVLLSDAQVRNFVAYEALLASWSDRVRLISRGDVAHLRERHILESLGVIPFLEPGPLLDLGTGGGLPGIPIQIAQPERRVCLVESARMKCLFLRHVVDEIGLTGAEVCHERVENLHRDTALEASFNVVTARAVADLDRLWEWSRPLLRPKGVLVALKGPGEVEQWEAAEGWGQVGEVSVDMIDVPPAGRKRAIVRVRKAGSAGD